MKKYRCIVRTETHSFSFIVEADDFEEAWSKAYDMHGSLVTTAKFVELK